MRIDGITRALENVSNLAGYTSPGSKAFSPGRLRCPFCKKLHYLKKAELFALIRGLSVALPKERKRGRPRQDEKRNYLDIVGLEISEDTKSVALHIEGQVTG